MRCKVSLMVALKIDSPLTPFFKLCSNVCFMWVSLVFVTGLFSVPRLVLV